MKMLFYGVMSVVLPVLVFMLGAWFFIASLDLVHRTGWWIALSIVEGLGASVCFGLAVCGPMITWAAFAIPGDHGCKCPLCYRGFK